MRTRSVLIAAMALSGLTALWARSRYVVVTVRGESMSPTLAPGERVLIRRGLRGARRGAIVVLREPDVEYGWRFKGPLGAARPADASLYIKRVVATAGDRYPDAVGRSGTVPGAHVAVLGDHPVSVDSRHHGPCPAHQILGVMVRRVGTTAGPRDSTNTSGATAQKPG